MARPSVIPQIKENLKGYLDEIERKWLDQPDNARRPTLPLTNDGVKVDVTAVGRDIGLGDNQIKYLHEKQELKDLINVVCDAQGVGRIGSRLDPNPIVSSLRQQVAVKTREANASGQAAIEASASERDLILMVDALQAEIQRLKLENASLREQLDLVRQGILVEV